MLVLSSDPCCLCQISFYWWGYYFLGSFPVCLYKVVILICSKMCICFKSYRWIEVFSFSSYMQTNSLSRQSRARFLNRIELFWSVISMCTMFSMLTFYIAHCMNEEDAKFKQAQIWLHFQDFRIHSSTKGLYLFLTSMLQTFAAFLCPSL